MNILEIENSLNKFVEDYDKQKTGNDCMLVLLDYVNYIKQIEVQEIKTHILKSNMLAVEFERLQSLAPNKAKNLSDDEKFQAGEKMMNFFMHGLPFMVVMGLGEVFTGVRERVTPNKKQLLHSGAIFDQYFIKYYKIIFKNFMEMCNDQLLNITSGLKFKLPSTTKRNISISKSKGIYINKDLKYPIKADGRRFKIILSLKESKKSINNLTEELNTEENKIIKDITDINRLFREKLKLEDNIILHLDTGGYVLNNERFEIIFEE